MLPEKISAHYRSMINNGDPADPLAIQVYFSEMETIQKAGDMADPIGDVFYQSGSSGRLIHRHSDRALLLLTDRCPAHCRFCFRRGRLAQSMADITDAELEEALRYIGEHKEIQEIILTGGDPLSLSDERLLEIICALRINGIASIRMHTRFPIYEPSRCRSFSRVAANLDAVVVHINHHREISTEFSRVIPMLRAAKFLLNQSVLLKGVNDSVQELMALSYALGDAGILPYHLHYPDLAIGISHFRIPLDEAMRLVDSLACRLPGYLIPRLILDIPGGKGKVALPGALIGRGTDGAYLIKAPLTGETVEYRDGL